MKDIEVVKASFQRVKESALIMVSLIDLIRNDNWSDDHEVAELFDALQGNVELINDTLRSKELHDQIDWNSSF